MSMPMPMSMSFSTTRSGSPRNSTKKPTQAQTQTQTALSSSQRQRQRQRQRIGVPRSSLLLGMVVCVLGLTGHGVDAFSIPPSKACTSTSTSGSTSSSSGPSTASPSPSTTASQSSIVVPHMSWSEVSDFYQTYPIQSAVLTCGIKASMADGIAQVKALLEDAKTKNSQILEQLQPKRNLAYILYGGIFIGIMCHVEYHEVFPRLFGPGGGHVIEKVLLDNFVSAPLMWLPPAYLIKALMYQYDQPFQQGLKNYQRDIVEHGLLFRYWAVWLPAQSFSFSVVPDHMRVAFMASISFFWFILFSSVASQNDATATATDIDTTSTSTTAKALQVVDATPSTVRLVQDS